MMSPRAIAMPLLNAVGDSSIWFAYPLSNRVALAFQDLNRTVRRTTVHDDVLDIVSGLRLNAAKRPFDGRGCVRAMVRC